MTIKEIKGSTMQISSELNTIISEYTSFPNIESILLIGSRATQFYDELSDYDLFIIFSGIKPSIDSRLKIMHLANVLDFRIMPDENVWNNEWILNGESFSYNHIKIDAGYQSIDFLKTVVNGVVTEGKISLKEMSFRPYTIPGLLEESITLFDKNGEVTKLKSFTRPYPFKLKAAVILQANEIIKESISDLVDYCSRSIGNNAFMFHLWKISDSFCQILFALNEKYDLASKRTEEHFRFFTIKPANFESRFQSILQGPFDKDGRNKTVNDIKDLFSELNDLISHNIPELKSTEIKD